ncbi:MAG: hypothetical protein ACM32K_09115, partial [Syntrophaceae bacterium]
MTSVPGFAVGQLHPQHFPFLGQQRLDPAVRADLDLPGERFVHPPQHIEAVLRADVADPRGDELQAREARLLGQLLHLGGEIAEEPVGGAVIDVDPVGLGQQIEEGLVVEEIAQVPAHLGGEGQLAVAVGPGAAPAAEHVPGAPAASLPDAFSLFQQKHIPG